MKPIAMLTTLAALAAVALVSGAALVSPANGSSAAVDNGITVTGNGTVEAVPDRAQLSFDVESSATTAAQAIARVSTESNAVNTALRNAGIGRADLQTAQVSLQPRRSDNGAVTGFVATTTVTVNLKDLSRTGRVIDAAVSAGATGIFGPSLSKSDTDALYADALKAAVANARAKAQTLAAASGVVLGRATTVVEGGSSAQPMFDSAAASAKQSDVPIEAGTQQISASVTVTFAAG